MYSIYIIVIRLSDNKIIVEEDPEHLYWEILNLELPKL